MHLSEGIFWEIFHEFALFQVVDGNDDGDRENGWVSWNMETKSCAFSFIAHTIYAKREMAAVYSDGLWKQ